MKKKTKLRKYENGTVAKLGDRVLARDGMGNPFVGIVIGFHDDDDLDLVLTPAPAPVKYVNASKSIPADSIPLKK